MKQYKCVKVIGRTIVSHALMMQWWKDSDYRPRYERFARAFLRELHRGSIYESQYVSTRGKPGFR